MSGSGGGGGGGAVDRQQQPACGQEALDLLNCVAQTPYDHDKCLRLLNSLRECVLNKVKYLHDFVGRLRVSIAFCRSRARCAPDLAVGLDGVSLSCFCFSSLLWCEPQTTHGVGISVSGVFKVISSTTVLDNRTPTPTERDHTFLELCRRTSRHL